MNNLFLTGDISIGKTSLLKLALDRVEDSIGGFITKRVIEGHFRIYLSQSLDNRDTPIKILQVDSRDWSKRVFTQSFSNDLVDLLDHSFKYKDLIVLDELGNTENDIEKFTSKIFELLDSDKAIFGVLKDSNCKFLNQIRQRDDIIIIEITEENRDLILDNILDILQSFGININRE